MLNTYFLFAFVAKWLFAFFRIYFPGWQHVSIYYFSNIIHLCLCTFFPSTSKLRSPSPLRDWTHCQFYFLLVFLWFDVDLYNITILHGLRMRMRTHESRWISNLQSKVFLKVLCPDQYQIIFIFSDLFKITYFFQWLLLHFENPHFKNESITLFSLNL